MWKCDRCGKVFQHHLHVAQHRRIHSVYRPYKCHFGSCLQSCHNLSKLQRHQRSHIDHRRYYCRICRVRFLQKVHLEHHKCRPHVHHIQKCHVCSATFLRIISLANHIHEQHPGVAKAKRLKYREFWKTRQKRKTINETDLENTDDSKILLKISLGKSMTIISPSKQSPSSIENSKRVTKKKSKKKRRKDDKKPERKGIILSIKKGMVNVKDKRIDVNSSNQRVTEKNCGLSSTEYKVREKKSELKLTFKACPDLSMNTGKGETYKVLERSDSRSSLKLEKRLASGNEIDKFEGRETVDLKPSMLKDSSESKVRNGVVITKDKSGKFLAEQLPALKSKKRENVFESFNDVGIWKVLESPRDRPNDILRLKLSPQKPARIESTLEEACAYNAARYLDIPVDSVKVKGEASGEDSDVLELLPPYDKENDGGMNNVNDSGIEVLSSSSCNRSNGNSVRSVVNEDNSPTYFNTEDSMFSLDSPITEVVNKSEHSICHKCGGIIMETNNNAQSPGKCRCDITDQRSFEMPVSPVKINLMSPERKNEDEAVSEQLADSKHEMLKDEKDSTASTQNSEMASYLEKPQSDDEDSDIMIITVDKSQISKTEEGRSRLRLKLRSKDISKSPQKGMIETLSSPKKGKRSQSVSPHKPEKTKSFESVKPEYAKCKSAKSESDIVKSEMSEQDKFLTGENSATIIGQEGKNNSSLGKDRVDTGVDVKENVSQITKNHESDSSRRIIVIDEDDEYVPLKNRVSSVSQSEATETSKQIRKKPLFKSKKSSSEDISMCLLSSQFSEQSKQKHCHTIEDKSVQNKKPLFKKRTLSADGNTEEKAKRPCFKTQMSVPGNSTRESEVKNDTEELEVKQSVGASEQVVEGKNVTCPKSVSKLCIVGLEDDDSLQEFSGEIIGDSDKIDTPVEKAKKPAVSFDLYQQQFLSFISNTINSSKSSSNKFSDKACETKQDSKCEKEMEPRNVISKSPGTETESSKNRYLSPDKILPDQTAAERNSRKRNEKEPKHVKDKGKHKNVRKTRQLNEINDKKCADVEEIQSKKPSKCDKIHEETSRKNSSIGKQNVPEQDRSAVESDGSDQGNNKQKKELDTENELPESLKNRHTMTSIRDTENKSGTNTGNLKASSSTSGSEKNDAVAVSENIKTIEKSDSLSWLSIFGEKAVNGTNQKNKKESPADVMTDLSENLAEINKKIDVSEDDDTHSLDVDDVFQLDNLSSLEPKHEISFSTSQTNTISHEKTIKSEFSVGPPYKRKQTAKRSGGKFKAAKRKVESDLEYPDESSDAETIDLVSSHPDSDPDFNPFMDSDDDFVKAPQKRRRSRTCERAKKRLVTGSESSDSDNESKCSETDRLDSESQSSRSRRTKMGRKSCCPCCIGSPRKRSRDHQSEHDRGFRRETYKLPRKHREFVRSTLKLLQLQEKIHTLFLTLFPECAEIITRSNIGTEEFESLIDDILNVSEEKEALYSSTVHSYMKKTLSESQFDSCPANNIEMPFTAPGSASRTSEIDLVNTSGEDNCCPGASVVQAGGDKSQNDLDTRTVYTMENKFDENTAGKEIDAGISWQQTNLFSQPSLMAQTSSSCSLKFENNTITDNDESMEENMYGGVTSYPSVVSESSMSFAQESVVDTVNTHYNIENNVDLMNVGAVTHLDLLDHSESFNNMDYFPPEVSSVPVVQNEITITLDLNAVRVSLCRSPKSCLEKLQNQIIKLTKYFLPKLEFKSYFYKNIDNLEFLLDLMIEANSSNKTVAEDSENELVEETITEKWLIPSNDIEIIEAPIIKEDDTVKVNFLSFKNDSKTEEREPLFVKCSDLFEQEIKSQRESLKKDVFSLEEDRTEDTWKSAEEVLSSINSLKKMAKRTEMAHRTRRPRESRLRKRSADEKRTLFVQEKLQNSQNSTFVCNTRTRSGNKKVGKKASRPENSKKRFLSELNLGDKLTNDDIDIDNGLVENCSEEINGHVISIDNKNSEIISLRTDNVLLKNNFTSKTEKTVLFEQSKENDSNEAMDDADVSLKSGDKNIFELMQPP